MNYKYLFVIINMKKYAMRKTIKNNHVPMVFLKSQLVQYVGVLCVGINRQFIGNYFQYCLKLGKEKNCWSIMWIYGTIFFALIIINDCKYMRIKSKPRNVFFKYREGITGEKTLPKCRPHDACNILYKQFWMDDIVERLCKCPNGDECPWTDKFDNNTMIVNNRSFLKFCQTVNRENICKTRKTAALVHGKIDDNHENMIIHRVRINCYCPKFYFWHVKKYHYTDNNKLYQHYRCSKQRMCESYEFCGIVRNDLYSTYYRCSCPVGHLCITRDKKLETVQEFLYSGAALNAHCEPWNISSRYY